MPVFYKDMYLDCGYRVDVVVEDRVIVEIKSVSCLTPIHEAQLLSYLRLSDCKIGLLINFQEKKPMDERMGKMFVFQHEQIQPDGVILWAVQHLADGLQELR